MTTAYHDPAHDVECACRVRRDDHELHMSGCPRTPGGLQTIRARAWYGFKSYEGSAVYETCPRSLAGKRCRLLFNERCTWCSWPKASSSIWDHRRRWVDANGQHVITSETYGDPRESSPNDFTLVIAAIESLGLSVKVGGTSMYQPNDTTLITIRRASETQGT